jgi:hypothetical protein
MKKISFILTAFLAVMQLSSCSNDDINIDEKTEVSTRTDLTVSVSTQSVYDDFNISQDFKERLLSDSYTIGVYTFVYDKDGNLAAADSTYTDTFGKVEQKFSRLDAGSYTVITAEMAVDKTTKLSPSWTFLDREDLNSIRIYKKVSYAYWYSAVGLYTKQIELKDAGLDIDATPSGIGVIINSYFMNFDKSQYKEVALYTKDQPTARYLSPNRKGSDRFYYSSFLNSSTWYSRGYINGDDGLGDSEYASYYLLESGSIKYCYGVTSLDDDSKFNDFHGDTETFTVVDGKNYYGCLSYVGVNSDGDCAAALYNTLDELNNWYSNLNFNFKTFVMPYLQYIAISGNNVPNLVYNYMLGEGMIYYGDGTTSDSQSYYSIFQNANYSVEYDYYFNTDKTKLQGVNQYFDSSMYTVEKIVEYLESNGYTNEGLKDNSYYYLKSKLVVIYVYLPDDGVINVAYRPNVSIVVKTSVKPLHK